MSTAIDVIEVTHYEDDNSLVVNVYGSESASMSLTRRAARSLGTMLVLLADDPVPGSRIVWEAESKRDTPEGGE